MGTSRGAIRSWSPSRRRPAWNSRSRTCRPSRGRRWRLRASRAPSSRRSSSRSCPRWRLPACRRGRTSRRTSSTAQGEMPSSRPSRSASFPSRARRTTWARTCRSRAARCRGTSGASPRSARIRKTTASSRPRRSPPAAYSPKRRPVRSAVGRRSQPSTRRFGSPVSGGSLMIVTELFSKVPLFEGVSPEDRAALARAATLRTYRRGETIVQQGQPGDAFYVLVRGRVAVAIIAPDGREVVLNTLGEGDHFGEMALLDDAPRSASVIAQEKSDLAILSRAVFLNLLKSNFVLTRALLGAFSARLRRANATIEGLASLDVKSRLARYFRELAATRGRKAGGGWSVVVRPSQREIADTIGSSREPALHVERREPLD